MVQIKKVAVLLYNTFASVSLISVNKVLLSSLGFNWGKRYARAVEHKHGVLDP